MRTCVYIDGFNLYYGALKGTSYKWLNLVKLSNLLLPQGYTVDKVLYFTARVSGAADPDAPRRQNIYLSALSTLPEVEIHFGKFLAKTAWRPLINLPVADKPISAPQPVRLPAGNHQVGVQNPQILTVGNYPAAAAGRRRPRQGPRTPSRDTIIAEFHTMEEKGSDVNLAAHLLNDAWAGRFDAAAVISNDTDLVTPIRMVTAEQGKPVFIVCPGRWQAARPLRQVANHVRHIRSQMLRSAQFPDPITQPPISKPTTW